MKYILIICLFLTIGCSKKQSDVTPPPPQLTPPPQRQEEPPRVPPASRSGTYEGKWVTTNRELDGTMKCVVNDLKNDQWKGNFSGVWMGRRFSYDVEWTGPVTALKGTAKIDGANYQWTGTIDDDGLFKVTFTGNRYKGYFNLKKIS